MVSGSLKQPLGIRGRTALREVTQTQQSLHRWENGEVSKERNSYGLFFQKKTSENEGRTFSRVIILSAKWKPALREPWVTWGEEDTEDRNDVTSSDLVGFCLGVFWLPGPGRLC